MISKYFGATFLLVPVLLLLMVVSLVGCAELFDNAGGYGDDGYYQRRSYDYDPYYNDGWQREQFRRSRRLNQREEELHEEQRRLQAERDQLEATRRATASRQRETCPAGFRPSENKCSAKERRRGCRDMRLPGGLGCVSRR